MFVLKKQFEKLLKKLKNLLTNMEQHGNINESSETRIQHRKKFEKKFLTNENRCDKVNELSERQKQRTLITKQ